MLFSKKKIDFTEGELTDSLNILRDEETVVAGV